MSTSIQNFIQTKREAIEEMKIELESLSAELEYAEELEKDGEKNRILFEKYIKEKCETIRTNPYFVVRQDNDSVDYHPRFMMVTDIHYSKGDFPTVILVSTCFNVDLDDQMKCIDIDWSDNNVGGRLMYFMSNEHCPLSALGGWSMEPLERWKMDFDVWLNNLMKFNVSREEWENGLRTALQQRMDYFSNKIDNCISCGNIQNSENSAPEQK